MINSFLNLIPKTKEVTEVVLENGDLQRTTSYEDKVEIVTVDQRQTQIEETKKQIDNLTVKLASLQDSLADN